MYRSYFHIDVNSPSKNDTESIALDGALPHREAPKTLAEIFFRFPKLERRQELEEYRIRFEGEHGPTDLTRRYTSMWPDAEREWLFKNHTKKWFDGLPPFAKGFLRDTMDVMAREGNLDSAPNRLVQLYVSKQMHLDHEMRNR